MVEQLAYLIDLAQKLAKAETKSEAKTPYTVPEMDNVPETNKTSLFLNELTKELMNN